MEATSSQVSQQQDTLHVAAMSLNELNESNVNIFPFAQLLLNFPNPARYFTSQEEKATEYCYHYQMQKVSETAKIFKYISECIFHRTQLMTMHNTIMTSNTNSVPPSKTHVQLPSSTAEPLTVKQFK